MIITFSFSFYDKFFIANVIQTSCFFFLEKVAGVFRRPPVLIETPDCIILMTCRYLDLGRAVEANFSSGTIKIRGTTQVWVVTRHQYGISELASQGNQR